MLDFFKKLFKIKPKRDSSQIDYAELYSILEARLFRSVDRKYRKDDKWNITPEGCAPYISYYWSSVKHLSYADKLLDLAFTIQDNNAKMAMWLQVKGTEWEKPFTARTLGQRT